MSKKDNNCALCGTVPEKDEPTVLALGSYGYPRCLCEECEAEIDTATLGRDYDEIVAAITSLADKTEKFGRYDHTTFEAMQAILEDAAKRAAAIKDGSYDFSLDEQEGTEDSEESFDEIPEALRETEEDRALDEKEAKTNKVFDSILNWAWLVVFVGIIGFFLLKFVFKVI